MRCSSSTLMTLGHSDLLFAAQSSHNVTGFHHDGISQQLVYAPSKWLLLAGCASTIWYIALMSVCYLGWSQMFVPFVSFFSCLCSAHGHYIVLLLSSLFHHQLSTLVVNSTAITVWSRRYSRRGCSLCHYYSPRQGS